MTSMFETLLSVFQIAFDAAHNLAKRFPTNDVAAK